MSGRTGHLPQKLQTAAAIRAAAPGLTRRQLEYWIEMGWVRSEGAPAQGHPRVFSSSELKVLSVLARLVRAGLPAKSAAAAARAALASANDQGLASVDLAEGVTLIVRGI